PDRGVAPVSEVAPARHEARARVEERGALQVTPRRVANRQAVGERGLPGGEGAGQERGRLPDDDLFGLLLALLDGVPVFQRGGLLAGLLLFAGEQRDALLGRDPLDGS